MYRQHIVKSMAAPAAGRLPARGEGPAGGVFTKQTQFAKTNPFSRPGRLAGPFRRRRQLRSRGSALPGIPPSRPLSCGPGRIGTATENGGPRGTWTVGDLSKAPPRPADESVVELAGV